MQKHEFYFMFTGIIECQGQVRDIFLQGTNKSFWVESPISAELSVDQSVAHNGVCLTVEAVENGAHKVTAIDETLNKTALHQWQTGSRINLERALVPSGRLDGHFVQGHVDSTATCKKIRDKDGSHVFEFRFAPRYAPLLIEKGSVCIDGISLTAFDVKKQSFRVAIIPYTLQNTSLQYLKEEMEVNIEFDMIGKYILRKLSLDK
ncbi:MAG: riboflavin synthase [Flavisolibacter sp.]